MKKYIKLLATALSFGAAVLFSSAEALADSRSDELLKNLSDKIEAQDAYKVEFTVEAGAYMPATSGNFVVSGERYYINVSGMEVFFDGQVRQTYNNLDNELVVERSVPKSESLLSNPTNIFKIYRSSMSHKMGGSTADYEIIEMAGQDGVHGPMNIYISTASGLITKVEVAIEGSIEKLIFEVDDIDFGFEATQSMFSFDRSAHKGVEIIEY